MTQNELKPLVLVVDDVASNIQLMANFLKDKYRIKIATDGQRCIDLAHDEDSPDLILLDIEMPGMDGYEVCDKLKRDPNTATIPIIFVTAKNADDDEEMGLELGAVDYITKPFSPAIVLARVNTQIILKQQRDQLEKMALYDHLTDLYNRHYLMETASLKVSKAIRHGDPLSLLMIDIDHFKKINDTHGHDIGDRVIQSAAAILIENSRNEDIAARFGGEEFLLLLDHCDLESAAAKAEILRAKFESLNPEGISITASFGVAELNNRHKHFKEFLKDADTALYQAKDDGRNCICIADNN